MTADSGATDSSGAPAGQARRRARADGPVPDEAAAGQPAAGRPVASRAAASQAPRLPYEKARDELTELVKRLEAGGLTLEQSLELWERGERLADICAEWLEGARARLATAMARREDGSADPAAPF